MRRKPWINALKLILTFTAVILIARRVDLSSLLPTLRQCRGGYLLLSLAAQVGVSFLFAWRWRLMLHIPGLRLRKYLYFVYLGYFFNAFLPSTASSDAIRVLAFGRKYGAIQASIGVNLLARGMGLLFQILVGAAAVAIFRDQVRQLHLMRKIAFDYRAGLAMLALAALLAIVAYRFRGALARQKWVLEIGRVLADRRLLLQGAVVTLMIQLVSMLGLWLMFRSLYDGVALWQIILFPAIIQTVLVLPISFGGVGVRDYLNILLYSEVAGIPRDITLAVSILGYLPTVLFALAGWIWMVFRRTRSDG